VDFPIENGDFPSLPEGNHRSDHISVFPWTFRTKDRLEGDLHLHVLVGIQVARPDAGEIHRHPTGFNDGFFWVKSIWAI